MEWLIEVDSVWQALRYSLAVIPDFTSLSNQHSAQNNRIQTLNVYLISCRNVTVIENLETFSHKFSRLNNSHIKIITVKNNIWSCQNFEQIPRWISSSTSAFSPKKRLQATKWWQREKEWKIFGKCMSKTTH